MCKLPKAGPGGCRTERQVWEGQATGVPRVGRGRAGAPDPVHRRRRPGTTVPCFQPACTKGEPTLCQPGQNTASKSHDQTLQESRPAGRASGNPRRWLFAVICNLCFSPSASGSKNWDGRGGPARRSSRGACEPAHLPSSPASASAPLWASGHPSGPFVSG